MNIEKNEIWWCPRCNKLNFFEELNPQHCYYGCGYTLGDKNNLKFDWICNRCETKNLFDAISKKNKCKKCHILPQRHTIIA